MIPHPTFPEGLVMENRSYVSCNVFFLWRLGFPPQTSCLLLFEINSFSFFFSPKKSLWDFPLSPQQRVCLTIGIPFCGKNVPICSWNAFGGIGMSVDVDSSYVLPRSKVDFLKLQCFFSFLLSFLIFCPLRRQRQFRWCCYSHTLSLIRNLTSLLPELPFLGFHECSGHPPLHSF